MSESSRSRPADGDKTCGLVILIGLASVLAHAWLVFTAVPLRSANDRSRWCTVWSLAERGTFVIDELQEERRWRTIDRLNHEGHWYSTKPPLFPAAVAGVYAAMKGPCGLDLRDDPVAATRAVLAVVNLLPWAVAAAVWTRLLLTRVDDGLSRLVLAVLFGFGTLLMPFCGVLNNHFPAAAAVTCSLPFLLRLLEKRDAVWTAAGAAFFASAAAVNELPALAYVGLVGLAALRAGVRPAAAAVAATLPLLLAYVVATYVQTGGFKPFYAYYGTEKYLVGPDGEPTYWARPRGVDGAEVSTPEYIFHCLVGHHGLFVMTPFWLLTAAAWCGVGRRSGSPPRLFVAGTLVLTATVLGFYWTRFENYNYGGVSVALRWVLWLVPLWAWTSAGVVGRLQRVASGRLVVWLLLTLSLANAWWAAPNPWRHPWVYAWVSGSPR
ncbi:MAG: hypothetical protein AAF532_01485 [Planctomycetota bacterium]